MASADSGLLVEMMGTAPTNNTETLNSEDQDDHPYSSYWASTIQRHIWIESTEQTVVNHTK
jgi:hypothetical protein